MKSFVDGQKILLGTLLFLHMHVHVLMGNQQNHEPMTQMLNNRQQSNVQERFAHEKEDQQPERKSYSQSQSTSQTPHQGSNLLFTISVRGVRDLEIENGHKLIHAKGVKLLNLMGALEIERLIDVDIIGQIKVCLQIFCFVWYKPMFIYINQLIRELNPFRECFLYLKTT